MRRNLKIYLVVLICIAPVALSYAIYHFVRPEGRRNFGELIEPQRPIPQSVAFAELQTLKGQWLLLGLASKPCAASCEHNRYLLRQLRESLGVDKSRLDALWISMEASAASAPQPSMPADLPPSTLFVPENELAAWLAPAKGQQLADHLYVVDPLGHWMLRFPANLDLAGASKARKDLDRLLRASAFWQRGRSK